MLNRTLQNRIERAEQAAKAQSKFSPDCICFPENERPFFGTPFEMEIAAKLKCRLHGDRFPPQFFVFVSKWLRDKLWKHLWSHHTEQYRQAWFASFPPDLWPAVEEETEDGRVHLRLKDGTRLLVYEPAWTRKRP
jgi:hypothetical protein